MGVFLSGWGSPVPALPVQIAEDHALLATLGRSNSGALASQAVSQPPINLPTPLATRCEVM